MLELMLCYLKVFFLIVGSLVLVSCVTYTDTLEVRSQVIDITSSPRGAQITMADENGTRSLGETPTQLDAHYQVTQRTYDKASCALAGAGAVSTAMSDDDCDDGCDDEEMSEVEAIIGIVGLFAGAAAGAAACAEADGVVAVHPNAIGLQARLEGYHAQKVVIVVPKEKPLVHFEMVSKNRKPKPRVSSRRIEGTGKKAAANDTSKLPRVVVLDVSTSAPEIGADLVESLSVFLTEEIADSDGFVTIERAALQRVFQGRANAGAGCSHAACKKEIAKSLGAALIVETEIAKKENGCLVAVSLIESDTQNLRLLAATQTSCDEEGLTEAVGLAAGILTSPPERSL